MNEAAPPVANAAWRNFNAKFQAWAQRVRLSRKLAFLLTAAALLSGIATFATMTGTTTEQSGPDPQTVLALLYIDGVLLLLLGAGVARKLVKIWSERRQGVAGSGLHVRMVILFSILAVTPAILVVVFAGLFMNFGVQAWFSERVQTALEESRAVAQAYLHEHQQSIRAETFAMANDLNRDAAHLMRSTEAFNEMLSAHANVRGLTEAVVVDESGKTLARSELALSLEFEQIPPEMINAAKTGEIVMLTNPQDDRVRAIIKLDRFVNTYLIVGKFIEPFVLNHIDRTEATVAQYKRLEERRGSIQITFVMIFIVVAVLLLLAAVWIGMTQATQLVHPISRLIVAAEKVGEGQLAVRVDPGDSPDEIAVLSRAFNRMTDQLESQRSGLINVNRELDERRHFTETVLEGVTAGVIGLDGAGRINLPNRSASELLGKNLDDTNGELLESVVPEMAEIVAQSMMAPERMHRGEINITRGERHLTLLVNVAAERLDDEVVGFVVTFDDVTALLNAQRKAAWADVARRIAHEIKNPLTPIQLSAERLKRKYLEQITGDRETFVACTETIMRQVEDIGRMVDEFSSFARMPQPMKRETDLVEICRQTVFLERNRSENIVFDVKMPDSETLSNIDSRQITQALTNLLKNASESIETRLEQNDTEESYKGKISISLVSHNNPDRHVISVEDNGLGLPQTMLDRLTEPYVTTRDKGTGLGLAIVRKIMEDHDGELIIENLPLNTDTPNDTEMRARISLVFLNNMPKETKAQGKTA